MVAPLVPNPPLRFLSSKKEEKYDILLEDFSAPKHAWRNINDPVMGGQSVGSFRIDGTVGILDGKVNMVHSPRFDGPGFVYLEGGNWAVEGGFPDVSTCQGLKLQLRSTTPDYQGFRISFGTEHDPADLKNRKYIRGHKAHFFVLPQEADDSFQTVLVPFTEFSLDWDPRTGDAVETCEQSGIYCPDLATLQDMRVIAIMGEGALGPLHLEIQSISATGCGGEPLMYWPDPSSSSNGGRSFFILVALLVIASSIAWYRKRRAKSQNYYQAVQTTESATTPEEAGYALEMS